jgi:hypothetical protein
MEAPEGQMTQLLLAVAQCEFISERSLRLLNMENNYSGDTNDEIQQVYRHTICDGFFGYGSIRMPETGRTG